MGQKSKLVIKEDLTELRKILQRQTSLTGEKRVKSLIYILEEKFRTRKELATYLGVHIRTMERWHKIYEAEGIDAMISNKPKPKPSSFITPEVHEGLKTRVNTAGNPFLGYWDAQLWIKQEYGIDVNYHTIRKYLIKHFKTKVKSPRKSHIKKDAQAIEAFFKTT